MNLWDLEATIEETVIDSGMAMAEGHEHDFLVSVVHPVRTQCETQLDSGTHSACRLDHFHNHMLQIS